MGFDLIDVLFMWVSTWTGIVLGAFLSSPLPPRYRLVAMIAGALGMYLALMYPFYTRFGRLPMVHPRCPCCGHWGDGFHVQGVWPRGIFRCPNCDGEFVVWLNGKRGAEETWERPVLVLKWPYAIGTYWRVRRPERAALANAGRGDPPQAPKI